MRKKRPLTDEEMAEKLVNLYLQEVARLGLKRNLGLDEVINAYYYALHRLSQKNEAMQRMEKAVKREEQELQTATRRDIVPHAFTPPIPASQESGSTIKVTPKKTAPGYDVEEEVREETYEEKKN